MGFFDFLRDILEPKDDRYYGDYYYDYGEEYTEDFQKQKSSTEKPMTQNKPVNKPVENIAQKNESKGVGVQTTYPQTRVASKVETKQPTLPAGYQGPMPIREDVLDKSFHQDKFFKYYRREKKDIIIFVIENSGLTSCYKNEIESIMKRMIEINKNYLFMILKVGVSKQFSDVLDYDLLTKSDILSNLFNENEARDVDYVEALEHITKFYADILIDYEYNGKKYEIQNINLIFIGSGKAKNDPETTKKITKLIAEMKTKRKNKTIKYFCMTDRQAIDVAKLGFPIIGHINNNFYE